MSTDHMAASRAALHYVWTLAGGDPAALDRVRLTGSAPLLPSSFRVGSLAQASIAAACLAAAECHRIATGCDQSVSVDMRHAEVEFRSERYMRIVGAEPPPMWDPIAGVYQTGDGRFVRLHTNFPHHRANVLAVLGCGGTREEVAAALATRAAEPFETEAIARGAVVAMMRTEAEWAAHPHGKALQTLPVIEITKIGDAPPRLLPAGERPLAGLHVLDLSRVIAGPVAGRTLAAHGADVLLVTSPNLPNFDWLSLDTGRGKRATFLDLHTPADRETLTRLLSQADILSQGYRPDAIARLGFGPEDAQRIRPGIVYVSLCAYGRTGPWAGRRGFDSLVQTAVGINAAEADAAGIDRPKELPAQALDHATGYLMAFGAIMARIRQAREGGSWHVQVSLAQTAEWLRSLGRLPDGLQAPDASLEDIQDLIEETPTALGTMRAVQHAAMLSETPARWTLPAAPLGSSRAEWT